MQTKTWLLLAFLAACHHDTTSKDTTTDTTNPTDTHGPTDTSTTPPHTTPSTGDTAPTHTTPTTGGIGASVLQHHNHANRDGVYVDPALTRAAVAGIHVDPTFDAPLDGPVYAQPLFVDGLGAGKDLLIVVTEQNVAYAFDAADGSVVWQTPTLATPVALNDLPCGNIDPLGVTGTPAIDLDARTMYFGAMSTPDNGNTQKHLIYGLSIDDGSVLAGFPVDVESTVPGFASRFQNERGAVVLLDGIAYVPYGGHYGDCGTYYGWAVGVDTADPTQVTSFRTAARGGGSWAPAGISTDGTSLYLTTGNTFGASNWSGGDAVLRLAAGPTFSQDSADYFTPANWKQLDTFDLDMGTHALVHAPSLTPTDLVLAFGKDGTIYVTDQADLGGVGNQLSDSKVTRGQITGGVTAYTTSAGTFVSFRVEGSSPSNCPSGRHGNQGTVLLGGSPPAATIAWCSSEDVLSLPIVSMTDAAGTDAVTWNMSDARLYAYDGVTGDELFAGGGSSDVMRDVQYFQTPIVAKGRVYVAGVDHLYAFTP